MELIKSAARRTKLGEIGYVLLNVLYAGLALVLLLGFEGQPYFAYLLVLLSKWRVFAVRPRFWMANIQTNMLDTLMGISVVTLLWQNMGYLGLQLGITAFYTLWLVVLKPSSRNLFVVVQGGLVQFVSLMALFSVAYAMNDVFVVLLGWLIGFVVARHVINIFNDELEDVVVSMAWGMVIAELSWLMYHWTIAYTPLKIPQVSIVASLLGYMTLVAYNYLYHHKDGKDFWKDVSMPITFALVGVGVLLIFFNSFNPTG